MKLLLVALCLFPAFLLGCGPVYSRAGPGSSPSSETGRPEPGGALTVWTASAPHQDPHLTSSSGMHGGAGLTYGYLFRYDTTPGVPNLSLIPSAVESWSQHDPITYLLQLRPGVRWHDLPPVHGRELTAHDVVYSLDRIRASGWPGDALLRDIAQVRAVDGRTVQITLREPSAPFLTRLANGHIKLVAPEAVAAGGGSLKNGPTIGTGPFMVEEVSPGKGVMLQRNPGYWEQDDGGRRLPYLDTLEALELTDGAARFAAFQTGVLDVVPCSPQECAMLSQALPAPQLLDQPAWTAPHIGLKVSLKPLQDVRVRKAISKALDRRGFHETQYARPFDRGWYHFGFVAPDASWLPSQDEFATAWDDDPVEAQRLLREAGYGSGLDLEFTCPNYGSDALSACEFLSRRLGRAGIHAPIKTVDPAAFLSNVIGGAGQFELYYSPQVPPMEADLWLQTYDSKGPRNLSGINDAELDRLILAQRRESNPDRRREALLDIQRRLLDQYYVLHPRAVIQTTALKPWVRNYSPGPDHPTPRWLHYAWVSGSGTAH